MNLSKVTKVLFVFLLTFAVLLSLAFEAQIQATDDEDSDDGQAIEESEDDESDDDSEEVNVDDEENGKEEDEENVKEDEDEDENDKAQKGPGKGNGQGNGKGQEMRNERANQQQERREMLQEAKAISMEEFHRVRVELKADAKKKVEELENDGDIDGAYVAQEDVVELDLKDKNSYKKLGNLHDQRRGHGGVKVFVNGKHPHFDAPPVIRDGRTLIPLRAVTEAMDAEVDWDSEERKVTVERDGVTVELYIGENTVYVNGEEITLDVPAGIENSRTFVPLRFISEALSSYVDWDEESGSAIVVGDDEESSSEESGSDEGDSTGSGDDGAEGTEGDDGTSESDGNDQELDNEDSDSDQEETDDDNDENEDEDEEEETDEE